MRGGEGLGIRLGLEIRLGARDEDKGLGLGIRLGIMEKARVWAWPL